MHLQKHSYQVLGVTGVARRPSIHKIYPLKEQQQHVIPERCCCEETRGLTAPPRATGPHQVHAIHKHYNSTSLAKAVDTKCLGPPALPRNFRLHLHEPFARLKCLRGTGSRNWSQLPPDGGVKPSCFSAGVWPSREQSLQAKTITQVPRIFKSAGLFSFF